MIKICFICSWGDDSIKILDRYRLFTNNLDGKYKNLIGIDNINISDIVVCLDDIPKNFELNLLKNKKVICFQREPFVNNRKCEKLNIEYYSYDKLHHVVTYPQFINKNFDYLEKLKYNIKDKIVSVIMSNKNSNHSYQLRVNFLINLSKKYPNLIDIYGAGWKDELGIAYKGELSSYHNKQNNIKETKYDALIRYKYSICIENCSINNYFTEKFTDAILCWTIPIYYGCNNIFEYFPPNSYYYIDINNPNVYDEIINIIAKPITNENIKALEEARYLILNKYNIWNKINDLI